MYAALLAALICVAEAPLLAAEEPSIDGKPLGAWIQALRDKNFLVRIQAADAIGRLGPAAKAAIPDLVCSFRDAVPPVADVSAYALGKIGPEAIPSLIAEFEMADSAVSSRAITALALTGKPGVIALCQAIVRLRPSEAGGRAVDDRYDPDHATLVQAYPLVQNAVLSSDVDVRVAAGQALRRLPIPGDDDLWRRLEEWRRKVEELERLRGPEWRWTPPVMPKIDGKVFAVKADQRLVVLTVGKDDGVKEGDPFFVVRGSEYIAKVRVIQVLGDISGARIEYTVPGKEIREGDNVTTRL